MRKLICKTRSEIPVSSVVFVSVFVSLKAVPVAGRRMQAINCLVRIKDAGLEISRPYWNCSRESDLSNIKHASNGPSS